MHLSVDWEVRGGANRSEEVVADGVLSGMRGGIDDWVLAETEEEAARDAHAEAVGKHCKHDLCPNRPSPWGQCHQQCYIGG